MGVHKFCLKTDFGQICYTNINKMSCTGVFANKADKQYPADETVYDSDTVRVEKYSGSKCGLNDHLLEPGALYMEKCNVEWEHVGVVVHVTKVAPVNGVNRFILVIEKNPHTGTTARTKKLLTENLGWLLKNDTPGIARLTWIGPV